MKLMGVFAGVLVAAGLMMSAGCSQCKSCGGGECEPKCSETKAAPAQSEAAPAKTTGRTETVAQKTCPVGGGEVDLAVFTEYQGKKVYFCCPGCITKFQKDPEKYMASLK